MNVMRLSMVVICALLFMHPEQVNLKMSASKHWLKQHRSIRSKSKHIKYYNLLHVIGTTIGNGASNGLNNVSTNDLHYYTLGARYPSPLKTSHVFRNNKHFYIDQTTSLETKHIRHRSQSTRTYDPDLTFSEIKGRPSEESAVT